MIFFEKTQILTKNMLKNNIRIAFNPIFIWSLLDHIILITFYCEVSNKDAEMIAYKMLGYCFGTKLPCHYTALSLPHFDLIWTGEQPDYKTHDC